MSWQDQSNIWTDELIESLKRTPMSKAAREKSMCGGGLNNMEHYTHPDFPGIRFPTRTSLKKAFRIQRYSGNTLRKSNMNRLSNALSDILFKNGVNIQKMAQSMIAGRLDAASCLKDGPLADMMRTVIREEIAKVFNPTGRTAQNDAAKTYIAGIVKEETRKIILENMDFDFHLSGRAFTNNSGRRAINLGAEHE